MTADTRVTWLVKSLGYGNRLLYWQPLLEYFVREFPLTLILTAETEAVIPRTQVSVQRIRRAIDLKLGSRSYAIPLPTLLADIAKIRPDILIISEFGLLSMYATLYRAISSHTRVLLLVENDPKYLAGYGVKRRSSFYRLIRRLIARHADRILCNTRAASCYVMSDLDVPQDKIELSCYLTSSIAAQRQERVRNRKELRLLFVGQLIPRKGVGCVIEALRIVRGRTERPIHFDIVGDGPDRPVLEANARQSKLGDVITFHGAQPYDQLGRFFFDADVFVLPTLGDYRALVGFEALSAGLPIIGSIFDGASEEVIRDKENGFVIDPNDTKTLADRLLLLAQDPDLLRGFADQSIRMAAAYEPAVAARNLVDACVRLAGLRN